jgi:hypothetical protein
MQLLTNWFLFQATPSIVTQCVTPIQRNGGRNQVGFLRGNFPITPRVSAQSLNASLWLDWGLIWSVQLLKSGQSSSIWRRTPRKSDSNWLAGAEVGGKLIGRVKTLKRGWIFGAFQRRGVKKVVGRGWIWGKA